jgi:hypothetical protein
MPLFDARAMMQCSAPGASILARLGIIHGYQNNRAL